MKKNSCWHFTVEETVEVLNTNIVSGLSREEINKRKLIYSNVLEESKKISPFIMFVKQFTDTMVLILLAATVLSGIVGDMVDAVTIMAIVILNAVLGFIQEYKAEKSLQAIKKLSSPYAFVSRDGEKIKIPAEDLLPGDIIHIEAGDKVPADIRLIECYGLQVDEAVLTGESFAVEKNANKLCKADTPLAEQVNMVFMGTAISKGRARGIVVNTGMQTVMGEIAQMIDNTENSLTPLQVKLNQLGKILIVICLLVCAVVVFLGIMRGEDALTMLMAGISLAVAAIPEGLPAIVTVVLALGVQRMAGRNAIVRKLPAVETLGCTTVICSDKTGTLTRNQMTVKKVASYARELDIEGDGYKPEGKFYSLSGEFKIDDDEGMQVIMQVAGYCNNAMLNHKKNEYKIEGDPSEGALLVMAKKVGVEKDSAVMKEISFDSERKRMSVVIEKDGNYYLLVKGALDVLVNLCSKYKMNESILSLNKKSVDKMLNLQEKWAGEALRVLGFAYKPLQKGVWEELADKELESQLILLGIAGIIDPPREESAAAVKQCLGAGIKPVMITGDHPGTARAIARQIGITTGDKVISGIEIDKLSDEVLYKRSLEERVFARVSPQHKNRIVAVLKKKGEVVAMTGDGVNDAPAIKAADIGIAMGITGTQVSKEASSMILIDDNFSTIVKAVYEGRAIYDNIRKFIRYLLGCNTGEVLVMFLSSLLGMPLPMLPIQILWVNLVTDGLPAMALGLEMPEPGVMERKPRPRNEGVFSRGMGWIIFSRGVYIAAITLSVFCIGLLYSRMQGIDSLETARTMAFTTLVFAQLFYVFECRSEVYSPFELGFLKNRFLLFAVSCSLLMQLAVIYLPVMQSIFKTVPLSTWQLLLILLLAGGKFFWKLVLYMHKKCFS